MESDRWREGEREKERRGRGKILNLRGEGAGRGGRGRIGGRVGDGRGPTYVLEEAGYCDGDGMECLQITDVILHLVEAPSLGSVTLQGGGAGLPSAGQGAVLSWLSDSALLTSHL